MVKSKIVFFAIIAIFASSAAAAQNNRYMVFFRDKAQNPFSISQPGAFLSPRAIDRRTRQGIPISEQDLPVTPMYLSQLRDAGAEVYFPTKWMNGVLVQCNAALATTISGFNFVDRVELVAPNARLSAGGRVKENSRNRIAGSNDEMPQLDMLDIPEMHADGYRGQGMVIAVFDSGFPGVNSADAFARIRQENRLDLTVSKDFVYNTNSVFQYDQHGTNVFSVIAGYREGTFTGGAYDATFQLYVTEEVPTEYRVEEFNWLFAAERADSAGADIIQSSLGYYDFDLNTMDYQKSQMNGQTTVVSRAAQWASDRGIIVVCSAGNEGNNSWRIITAPADARDVLAVANVNADGVRANSSSVGPAADNRIKPDVAALGTGTNVILSSGSEGTASGTSLSAPLITSLVAGVWQRYRELPAGEIVDAIRNAGSQAQSPDYLIGYGIPSYTSVVGYLEQKEEFLVYPNPFTDSDTITIRVRESSDVVNFSYELFSSEGRSLKKGIADFDGAVRAVSLQSVAAQPGLYLLRINWRDKPFVFKLLKK